ncbi:hypothetical protein B0G80_8646 [Paraburkholderia sp. BL6669N2]|nr:hypothetical protein B0G80_8646 [Paraburkholderia sp. BL6669N2]
MHRLYRYKDFTIEVNSESIYGIPGGKVLSIPLRYVAVLSISSGESSTTIQRLSFGQSADRPFATEAEALMRGYGAAQSIIDGMTIGSALGSMR